MFVGALACQRHSKTAGPYLELASNSKGVSLLDTINTKVTDEDHAYAVIRYEFATPVPVPGGGQRTVAILISETVDCTTNTAAIETMTALDVSDQTVTQVAPHDRTTQLGESADVLCKFIRRHAP